MEERQFRQAEAVLWTLAIVTGAITIAVEIGR